MSVFALPDGILIDKNDVADSLNTASYAPKASGKYGCQGRHPTYSHQSPQHNTTKNPFIFRNFHLLITPHPDDFRPFHTNRLSCGEREERVGGHLSRMEAGALTMIPLMRLVEYKYILQGGSNENKNFTC